MFEALFGTGYPRQDALRKQRDTQLLKAISRNAKLPLPELMDKLEPGFIKSSLERETVISYIMEFGQNTAVTKLLLQLRNN